MRKIEAVVLDWAGTVVDYGSLAPTSIFVEGFKRAFDFDISLAEARVPMGLGKWDHIKALGALPEVDARWRARFDRPMSDEDVEHIYRTFIPLQKAKVVEYGEPIPGALETINWLRDQGIKIGSCSGYPREIMAALIPVAAEHGYQPDCVVASDDLPAGARPGPWMALKNVIDLGVTDVAHCIKVDDSAPGITEGLSAGMWTVGVCLSGNAVGLTLDQWRACSDARRAELRRCARSELADAGAHFLFDTLAELPEAVQEISARLTRGERP